MSGNTPKGASGEAERTAEARARLDQIREEAGMPRRGDELAARSSISGGEGDDFGDPPLDWRLTPRNVFLQLLAVGVFVGVVWFFAALLTDSWSTLFRFLVQ